MEYRTRATYLIIPESVSVSVSIVGREAKVSERKMCPQEQDKNLFVRYRIALCQ